MDVRVWLEQHGLQQYAEVFEAQDIDLDVLPALREDHLRELNITLGDRLRLLRAIATMRPDPPEPQEDAAEPPDDPDPDQPSGVQAKVAASDTPPAERESSAAGRPDPDMGTGVQSDAGPVRESSSRTHPLSDPAIEPARMPTVAEIEAEVSPPHGKPDAGQADKENAEKRDGEAAPADLSNIRQALDLGATLDPAVEFSWITQSETKRSDQRQLTVMACRLVGSTALSSGPQTEESVDAFSAGYDLCRRIVGQHGGHLTEPEIDGLLAFFGYPQAHENDAERAVRAGLEICEAVPELQISAADGEPVQLDVRVGISSGIVAVDEIDGADTRGAAADMSETLAVATGLREISQPGRLIIGKLTRSLIREAFICRDIGEHQLAGLENPIRVWCVLETADPKDAVEATSAGAGALLGRKRELGLLTRAWDTARDGHGLVVLVQGEAGVGKSRLIDAMRRHVPSEGYMWVALRCSPHHGNTPLYPVIDYLRRVMGWRAGDGPAEKLRKMEATFSAQSVPLDQIVPVFAELMGLTVPAENYPPLTLSATRKRQTILDALVGWLIEAAQVMPVLQVWEDIHWADPTTLELLDLYIDRSQSVSMLNVVTFRPDFSPPWAGRSHMTPIVLDALERPEVTQLIKNCGGQLLPAQIAERIADAAGGLPLFVEHLTKAILETQRTGDSAADPVIPSTLQDALLARFTPTPAMREVMQMGAVLGHEFSFSMLQRLAGVKDEILQRALQELVDGDLLNQRGTATNGWFAFKHTLIHEAAYGSLSPDGRRGLHARVCELIETETPEMADEQPEQVARHCSGAGNAAKALALWRRAANRARSYAAHLEEIGSLNRALTEVAALDAEAGPTPKELALQVDLALAHIAARGLSTLGAETAFGRAAELCGRLEYAAETAPALFQLWRYYIATGSLAQAGEVADRLSGTAEAGGSGTPAPVVGYCSGVTSLARGRLEDAREKLTHALDAYQPSGRDRLSDYPDNQDLGVASAANRAIADWLAGYPTQAEEGMELALDIAKQIGDPASLAYALGFPGTFLSSECGLAGAEALIGKIRAPAIDGTAPLAAMARIHGAARKDRETPNDSTLEELDLAIQALLDSGLRFHTPYYLTLLARSHQRRGQIEQGLATLQTAREIIDARQERWWEPEVHRLKGELVWAAGRASAADGAALAFSTALDMARASGARSLELRAATSLARLRIEQHKPDQARNILDGIMAWFADGAEMADTLAAKRLMETIDQWSADVSSP